MNVTKNTGIIFSIVVILASQLACQAVTQIIQTEPTSTQAPADTVSPPTSVPSETSSPQTDGPVDISQFSDDEIKTGIQAALDLYAEAYNTNDPALFEEAVDQTNKPFRRIVRSRFYNFQSSYLGGQVNFEFKLLDFKKRDFGYVFAHFERQDGAQADWLFRYLEDRWVLTEPTVEQVGEPVKTETDHFIFTTYPWADDVNPQIMEMLENARSRVNDVLGKVPDEKASVVILPIYGLRPGNPSGAIALYNPSRDAIEVYTPHSFAFSFYDPAIGWDGDLQETLTHEYTHMTHMRSFNRAGKLSDWVSEGLAEYVSGSDYIVYSACMALKSGTVIPILDESDSVYKQDLMHLTILDQNVRLGYDYATSLVYYTVEEHGGMDGFWNLANALDETSDFKKAVQKAFGITYEQYNDGWQAWLKKQC